MLKGYSIKELICCLSFFAIVVGQLQSANAANEGKIKVADIKEIVQDIKKAIQLKDFKILIRYVPNEKGLYSSGCYEESGDYDDISSEEIIKALEEGLKGAQIMVNETPLRGENYYVIETEGWAGEFPFVDFFFFEVDGRLEWHGICRSPMPDPNKPYEKYPHLPRPGPRVFTGKEALESRVEEIIRFRAFDALKVYAVEGKLFVKPCAWKYGDPDPVHQITIDAFVDRFKRSFGLEEFILTPSASKEVLEVRGKQSGAHAYFEFTYTYEKKAWEWSTVAFCDQRVGWFIEKPFDARKRGRD